MSGLTPDLVYSICGIYIATTRVISHRDWGFHAGRTYLELVVYHVLTLLQ